MDAVNPTILKMTIEAIPTLTEENFSSWRTRISALFKLGGVKDQMIAGEPELEDNDNTMLCAIIIAKISPATHSNVVNAQLLWKAIINRFISSEPSNRARVYNAFANISFDASNIEKFITEVRSSIVKMEDVGIKLPEDIITYDLLRRLPSSLDNIKHSITHSKNGEDIVPKSLLDHLEIHLNELKVTHANQSEIINATMFTKEDPRCIPGHHNPYAKSHPKEDCWKVYPEKREAFMKRKEASQVSSFSTFSFNHPSIFILDSGSTSHMVSDRNLFTHLDESESGMINTSCGMSTLEIKGKGTIQLLFRNRPITLHNVLFVPRITVNVLSLRHLLIEQCTISFAINHFTVKKHDEIYLEGRYQHNLPVLELLPPNHHSHLTAAEQIHKSLGHVSYRRIRQKLGIPIKAPEVCKSCTLVKVTKASFKHRSSSVSKPLEELHLNLIGPISLMSHKKHKYILTIVDANTRFVAAIPLVTKSDTFKTLTHVINLEAKRLGYYPSILHSDRGTEFKNAELDRYCQEHVIRQSFSDAYTPQQNGLAERFNQTILESLRTVLLDSGLKATLWNEILSACTLTLNQIPTHRSKKSPYELFKKSVIPLQFFKPIGNPLVVLSNNSKSKLEPRGDLGRLLGFNIDLKSYRIQLTDGRIIDSKSVQFLDFDSNVSCSSDLSELIQEQQQEQPQQTPQATVKDEEKEEEDHESDELEDDFHSPDEFSGEDSDIGVQNPVPTIDGPVGRILRDRTLQVKPVKYTHFSEYSCFTNDPKTFRGAITGPNAEGWKNAIDAELSNIENHEVWLDQEEPPPKFLKHTWVFKTKPMTNSSPEKQKARLCIQGFLQTYGEDFFETFAPTGKFPSLLTLLVLAIDLQLPIKQFDVKSAFLFAPLEEEIYIKTPEGSKRKAPYLKVVKSLYGLKQAPKNWYETLTSWFQDIGYNPSVSDACLFIHKDKNSFIFFHVDDLVVVGRTEEFETLFLERFPNSTAHAPDTLLGMNLNVQQDSIELSQPALIEKGLELLDLQSCRPVKTPLTPAIQLHTATDEDHAAFLKLNVNYRSHTGMLNYLACRTRPDLASAVSILSKFNQKPGLSHWREVIHCWKYLKGTKNLGLLLRPEPNDLIERINFFTDATWAEDQESRISRSGSLAFWKSCPILWNSKKQKNITMSSTESEMNALSDGEQENQWLSFLIEELWRIKLSPTLFHIDNKGLIEKLKNFGSNSKTKHLDIKIKSLREKFKSNEIDVKLIPSQDMIADSLTKAAPHSSLKKFQSKCLTVLLSTNKEGC
jgi:hypothetical protein